MAETRHLVENDVSANEKIVNSASDLPTPAGGKITLVAGVKYKLGAPINIGTDYLELGNGTSIDSIGKDLTTITYTGAGAAIRGTNISCTLREIKVVGAPQGFEFTGVGIEGINIFQSTFQGCTKVGTVDGVYFFKLANSTFILNTDGVTMTDCSFINIDATNWFGNNSGTYLDIPTGSFESIKFSDNNLEVDTGNIGINIDESSITHNQKVEIIGSVIVGNSTTYYTGFNPLDGDFVSFVNTGIPNNTTFESVSTNEMFDIASPRVSMPLFNIDLEAIVYWDGANWISIDGTVIFNIVDIDDFESGSFATNGWTTVQGGENNWHVGVADPLTGIYSAYISNDSGTNNAYTSVGGALDVSHVYIDIAMPAGAVNDLILEFEWLCEAEVSYDYGQVHDVSTATVPVANTELGATGLVGQTEYNNQSIKTIEQIPLPIGEAGTTRRIVFSWRNDSSVENQPPFNFDNVKIKYR